MADAEKIYNASTEDPEKVTELGRKTTYQDGEMDDITFKHADPNDADEALKAFADTDGEVITMTAEEEKQLLRKIDRNLMPVRSSSPNRISPAPI